MERHLTLDPVTRIEGHGRISLLLDPAGTITDARFQVTQIRGFEHFVRGRPFFEMPSLTARTCGICPISHELASARACDQLLSVTLPDTAVNLRRLLNYGQLIQSHALSFFYLSSPDLLLGMDHDPATRNFLGVAAADPQFAREGIRLRRFGQEVIERLAGRRIHPAWVVPGGVSTALDPAARSTILAETAEVKALVVKHLDRFRQIQDRFHEETAVFAHFPSLFLGLVSEDGCLAYSDGLVRVASSTGEVIADRLRPEDYAAYIGEAVEPWTYLKFPYYRPQGYADGMYRVGPLARLNIADRCGTDLADRELASFRATAGKPALSSFHYHQARLIEMLHAVEMIERLLDDPTILDRRVRAVAAVNRLEGIGMTEAPRGTLIHHYRVNDDGLIQWANLIIATGHNNLAMNRGILQAARRYITGDHIPEGLLNRIEAVIRAFDPCLSCSTHAVGSMPLVVTLLSAEGEVLHRLCR